MESGLDSAPAKTHLKPEPVEEPASVFKTARPDCLHSAPVMPPATESTRMDHRRNAPPDLDLTPPPPAGGEKRMCFDARHACHYGEGPCCTPDPVKTAILRAAEARFKHYGYAKTTICDIAHDCGMSAGNLYRHFKNKLDIAAMVMVAHGHEACNKLRAVLARGKLTARQKLRRFLRERLKNTFHELENDPQSVRLAQMIFSHKPALAQDDVAREREMLVEILEEGRKNGEFAFCCAHSAAHFIQCATTRFRYPHMMISMHKSLDLFEMELEGVFTLIAAGLKKERNLPSAQAAFASPEPTENQDQTRISPPPPLNHSI